MNAHQTETSFWRHIIPDDHSDQLPKPLKTIARVRRNQRYMKRFAWVMIVFPLLAIAGIVYEAISQKKFPYDGSHPVVTVLCEIGLASLIYLVVFACLSMGHRKKSNRSQEECRQLVKGLLESHLRKPYTVSLSGSHSGSDAPDAFKSAEKASGYHANLDSPSWTSNRMCG
jgi:hypothetical protein